ncbi:DUF1778 domain-containing protein [Nitrolancea hollandica]|uniref:DUF1778 domain-containing protein n=1 Tax=Nitrolancea hollandica Lb TaxID=1129897 RepID=I4EFI4_9BACT|nr:DUF1778 domain-containing protein [Nitrolancea hollandica]CCF83446.1 conserved hypothetical protein [Nitrolancea hollandica Lb]
MALEARNKRLEARVTPAQKALIERAAALTGRTVTDFVVSSAQAAAEETIRTHEIVALTARESAAFVEALLNPPAPGENLRAAAQRYKEFMAG